MQPSSSSRQAFVPACSSIAHADHISPLLPFTDVWEDELLLLFRSDICSFSYLINLTKLAPQLSTEELTFLGKEMVMALTTCCTLSEEFACVDNLVSLAHIPDCS